MFKSRFSRIVGVIAIALPMVLVGAFSNFATEGIALRVETRTLTNEQLSNLVLSRLEQLSESYPRRVLESPEFIQQVAAQERSNYINRLLLVTKAEGAGLRVGNKELVANISSNELFRIDGRFSRDRYQDIIDDTYSYERTTRDDLLANKVRGMLDSAPLASGMMEHLLSFGSEERLFRKVTLPVKLDEEREITETEKSGFYNENLTDYIEPEAARYAHVTLGPDDFTSTAEIDEEALREDYEARGDRLRDAAERQLSMIMLADEEAAAAVYAELQEGADFAALARERSIDAGSKETGGDMGLLSRSDFPEAVAKVIFSTPVGELVPPQDLDGDWAVFKVTGLVGGKTRPFDEVRDELLAERREDDVLQQLEDRILEIEESLAADPGQTLAALAAEFGLEVEEGDWTVFEPGEEPPAPFDDVEVLGAALDEDFRSGGEVSPAIARADGDYIFLQALEVRAEEVLEFEEVAPKIELTLRRNYAVTELLQRVRGNLNAALEDGAALPYAFDDQEQGRVSLTGELPGGITEQNRQVMFDYQFYSNTDKLPVYVVDVSPAQDRIDLFRIDAIEREEPSEAYREEYNTLYAQVMRSLMEIGLSNELRNEYEVVEFGTAPEGQQQPPQPAS